MNRATWALLAASLLFGAAILAFVLTSGGGTTRVVRTQTKVVEAPPLTPLPRDSGPKNNPKSTTYQSPRRSGQSTAGFGSTTGDRARGNAKSTRPLATAPKPATTHKRPAAPQQPNTGGQSPPPPPAQPRPPVSATVPVPVTVCTRLATVNC